MKMYQLIEWFSINYPNIKDSLQNCHHNYSSSEVNPYHIEGDCWSHTMMVCKIAELKNFSKVVQISALLHDIAKPICRTVKSKYVYFTNHEKESANLAQPIVEKLVNLKIINSDEAKEIIELICMHTEIYKKSSYEIINKYSNKKEFLKHLIELTYCDDNGRFSSIIGSNLDNFNNLMKNNFTLK